MSKVKTKKEWDSSQLPLGNFIKPNDLVCEDIYFHMLEVLPPVYQKNGTFQLGEPTRHSEGKPMYMTFSRSGNNFQYLGLKHLIQEKIHYVGYTKHEKNFLTHFENEADAISRATVYLKVKAWLKKDAEKIFDRTSNDNKINL